MKKLFVLLLLPLSVLAQTGSEIMLLDLKLSKSGMEVSNPINITNRPGYDNQPSFHPDQPHVYYSSFNEEGRSEIKQYNFLTKETINITITSEREYSPTVTPDKQFLSCIIQRDNNEQNLGKYPIQGGTPVVLIDDLIVGYHAWMDEDQLILFVLGEPMTLRLYSLPTKTNKILGEKIGRSLHSIPSQKAMSFVDKSVEGNWKIKKLDSKSLAVSEIGTTLSGREDLAWTPDERVVMSDGEKLFYLNTKNSAWEEVKMDSAMKGITRIAISKDGKKIAVVVSE